MTDPDRLTRIAGEDNRRLRRIGLVSLAAHLVIGVGILSTDIEAIAPGIYTVDERQAITLTLAEETPKALLAIRPPDPVPPAPSKVVVRKPGSPDGEKPPEGRKSGGGGGDPLARVTKLGVLGRSSGSDTGTRVSSVEGGVTHASDGIAQVLRGVGETRRNAGGPAKGEPGIGFGEGIGSGFGGGKATQRAEDLVASFGDGSGEALVLEKRGALGDGDDLPFIEGGSCRDEHSIATVVLGHRGGVRGCYNRSLLGDPDREGEVGVRFIIDPGGTVTFAEVTGRGFHDPEMEECILSRIREWSFGPEPGCETVVRYSFHFSSGS
ncbi:MAG: AgmX/PglI C-terminal domain-containing protein [Candidatus Eisenbacteria bacterium]